MVILQAFDILKFSLVLSSEWSNVRFVVSPLLKCILTTKNFKSDKKGYWKIKYNILSSEFESAFSSADLKAD